MRHLQEQELKQGQGKIHPIRLYLKVWLLLFILSTCSYLVDFFQVEGYYRWFLIIVFMLAKAGLILAVFMHVNWERPAVKLLLFIPPIAILIFITLMNIEANYVFINRLLTTGMP
jgi:cytochrome c oxidase subunit IV